MTDAFSLLGVSPEDQLTDDEIRAAWRRIAAATHPDRADGGDPVRFAAAAAAYTELRTNYGRTEARAALGEADSRRKPSRPAGAGLSARIRTGRPARLALRVGVAAVAATGGMLAVGGGPAGPALVVGAATWLTLTARQDLGPP